jgi:hypothetical protein
VAIECRSKDCEGGWVVVERICTDCTGGGVAAGDIVWAWEEEPVIGEVEGETGGLRDFQGEPLFDFPLILSFMGAGEQVWIGMNQSCR